jgi:4-hydroxy-tetrahydrodipicolinate synthase
MGEREQTSRRWTWNDALCGVIPPLITPVDSHGTVDRAASSALAEYVLTAGCSGLFVMGGCGLGPWLTAEQRSAVVRTYVEAAAGRAPVLAGVMLPATGPAREAARRAEADGADALVIASPYYNTVGALEQRRHVEGILAAVELPVLLYNIPQSTHNPLHPEAVSALAREERVLGVKDSSADLWAFQRHLLLKHERPDFRVLQGDEHVLAASLLIGADGLIPGLANVAPQYFVAMVRAARAGDAQACRELQERVEDLWGLFTQGRLQAALMAACGLVGFGTGATLEPYEAPGPAQREAIKTILDRHGLLARVAAARG